MDTNTTSARNIADALSAIHREFSTLAPLDRAALAGAFGLNEATFDQRVDYAAGMLEATHPVEPLSDEENEELFELLYELDSDTTSKDRTWAFMDRLGEWGKRGELEQLREYMAEEGPEAE